jgi:hypothetical protein
VAVSSKEFADPPASLIEEKVDLSADILILLVLLKPFR